MLSAADVERIKRELKNRGTNEYQGSPTLKLRLRRLPRETARQKFVNVRKPSKALDNFFQLERHEESSIPFAAQQVLKDIYYDVKNPAGFSSPRKLFLASRKIVPYLTQQEVRRWLASQRTYGLTKAVYRNFRRRKVIVRGLAYQYQADLLDMAGRNPEGTKKRKKVKRSEEAEESPGMKVGGRQTETEDESYEEGEGKENDTWKSDFILTVIDCFSRFAQAVPLKSKKASDVLKGLQIAFEKMGIPKKMQTDDGKEFYNKQVSAYFRSMGIIHFSTDQELKAQIVERFNRTLREKINRYKTANMTELYHHALPDMIFAYNSSVHSALGTYAPKDVTFRNESIIRQIQYGPYLAENKPLKPKFKIGDVVRVVRMRKGLKKVKTTFKSELFVITDVLYTDPITYHVQTKEGGVAVWGSYYEAQLQKVLST